ncbi:MAG TPA: peptidase M1, partial [Acidobacteriaceae bacterium]
MSFRTRLRIVPVFRNFAAALVAVCTLSVPAWRTGLAAPVRPQLNITGYVIGADIDPSTNRLTATADVTFSALEDLTSATFELNNGLNITKLTD